MWSARFRLLKLNKMNDKVKSLPNGDFEVQSIETKEAELTEAQPFKAVDEVVDVVENKETVSPTTYQELQKLLDSIESPIEREATEFSILNFDGQTDSPILSAYEGVLHGVHWQQSQSIEGIVGFVLEAAKYAYDYHANSQFPEMSFEDNCKNNLLQWMQGKSDIIKEYNNGK